MTVVVIGLVVLFYPVTVAPLRRIARSRAAWLHRLLHRQPAPVGGQRRAA